MAQAKAGTELLLLGAMLDELGGADELDGAIELLLEKPSSLEELGSADELDGTTELLLGAVPEELGRADELDGSTELLLGSSLLEEEDGPSPVSTLDEEPSTKAFPM
jgi:hypothetical protein